MLKKHRVSTRCSEFLDPIETVACRSVGGGHLTALGELDVDLLKIDTG